MSREYYSIEIPCPIGGGDVHYKVVKIVVEGKESVVSFGCKGFTPSAVCDSCRLKTAALLKSNPEQFKMESQFPPAEEAE